jgi:hypothetical protein
MSRLFDTQSDSKTQEATMTNLSANPQIYLETQYLEALRSDAETYRQLQPIRARDLEQLVSAFKSILEIARNWSLGRVETTRVLKRNTV